MAAVAAADVLQGLIQKVKGDLQKYFDTPSDHISSLVKKAGDKVTINDQKYRIPFMQYMAGTFQVIDYDGGALPSGTGMLLNALNAGYYTSAFSSKVNLKAIENTNKPGQAVVNVFSTQLADTMTELQAYDEISFHGDGTSKLTNASSATGSWGSSLTTYTFANSTDTLGVGMLREGMTVDVYDSTGATKRAAAQIDHIDWDSKVVYLKSTVSGASSGDLLAFSNLTVAAGSNTLASFQSTWPFSGDSYRHGFKYANDATSSNYYLAVQKSSVTQLLASNVNASSTSLVFPHGLQLLDKLTQRRDASVMKGLIGVAHMAQRAQVHAIGIAISNYMRTKPSEKMIDVMPGGTIGTNYEGTFEFCGVPCYVSKRQDRARFDFIVPKNWGRAQLHDTKFFDVGGKTLFECRNSSGAIIAAQEFHVVQAYDFVCYDPGAQGYISSLALPSGY